MTRVAAPGVVLAALAGSLASWPGHAAQGPPQLESADCWFHVPPGRSAECAWLRTGDEALDTPVRLPVVRLPGGNGTGPPALYVPGGPGYPAGLDQAGVEQWWRWQDGARWDNDIVLFDPRGTGRARPAIDCPEIRSGDRAALDEPLTQAEEAKRLHSHARDCYRRLGGDRALSAFGPRHSVADVRRLIAALPESAVHLWGVSHGSRLALHVVRDHPQLVRSLVLDSVYPPSVNGFLAQPAQLARALTVIAGNCAAERGCARAYPDVAAAIDTLLEKVARSPLRLSFVRRLGEPETTLAVTGHRLLWMLFFDAYRPNRDTRVAQAVARAAAGDTEALQPVARRFVDTLLDPEFSHAVHYTASCAENRPVSAGTWRDALARRPRVRPYLSGAPAGAVCRFWDTGDVPPRYRKPAETSVPALVLHGAADPVTPPAWSEALAARLPRAQRVAFKGAGHAVTFGNHCATAVASAFLKAPSDWRPPACLAVQRAE